MGLRRPRDEKPRRVGTGWLARQVRVLSVLVFPARLDLIDVGGRRRVGLPRDRTVARAQVLVCGPTNGAEGCPGKRMDFVAHKVNGAIAGESMNASWMSTTQALSTGVGRPIVA